MRWGRGLQSARIAVDRHITPRVILVAGWCWFLVYAYPGFMSYDSVYQLSQARRLEPVNEWHPPVMAVIWRYLDMLVAGPFLMLVLQSTLFLAGLYKILGHVMSRRAAAITAVIVLILPQNIIVMAVIWKDSQMVGFLLAGIAALLSQNRKWRIAGYVLLFLATAFRYNAVAPTFPIVLVLFDPKRTLPWLKRLAAACGVWLLITVAAFVVNGRLVEKKVHVWETSAAPVDIAGTMAFASTLDDGELLREFPDAPWVHKDHIQMRARAWYRPENTFLEVVAGDGALFEYPTTDPQRKAIAGLWKKLVLEQPFAFLRHRIDVQIAQLESGVGVWYGFVNADWGEDLLHHRSVHSALQLRWVMAMVTLTHKRVFRPHMYMVLTLLLLLMCRRQRLAFVILASGVAHEAGLFLVAPAIDYRYNHWMVLCTMLGAIVLFVRRKRGESDPLRTNRAVERAA